MHTTEQYFLFVIQTPGFDCVLPTFEFGTSTILLHLYNKIEVMLHSVLRDSISS
jgi:hypothetical protein